MGIIDTISGGDFTGLSRAFGKGKHSQVDGGQGVTGTSSGGVMGGPQRPRQKSMWEDEDGSGPVNITLRSLQTFFPFINLCIYIGIAAFQKKWGVGPSGLTGLALFFNAQSLIHGAVFLLCPLFYDTLPFLRGTARALRQVRFSVIINGAQVLFMFLMAIITTVSANSGGCKNRKADPNAGLKGYTDAMGPFCRNKEAGAAFFWLNFFAWAGALAIVLYTWYQIRTNPKSTGFAIPGANFPADDEEAFNSSDRENNPYTSTSIMQGGLASAGAGMGYRPSGDYYEGEGEGRLFAESVQEYGQGDVNHGVRDPFADQEQNREEQEGYQRTYQEADPYEAIRKSMDAPYRL